MRFTKKNFSSVLTASSYFKLTNTSNKHFRLGKDILFLLNIFLALKITFIRFTCSLFLPFVCPSPFTVVFTELFFCKQAWIFRCFSWPELTVVSLSSSHCWEYFKLSRIKLYSSSPRFRLSLLNFYFFIFTWFSSYPRFLIKQLNFSSVKKMVLIDFVFFEVLLKLSVV